MLPGLNSDLQLKNKKIHLQTEDWGYKNPYIVSQIFNSGRVVKIFKIPYSKVLPRGVDSTPDEVQVALEAQHKALLDLLLSGQLASV